MPPPPMMGRPPPPPLGGVPPPPREAPPPPPEDEREAKRPRTDGGFVLEGEEVFLSRFPGASSVKIQCPEIEGNEKLIGQMLEVEVASLQVCRGERGRNVVWVVWGCLWADAGGGGGGGVAAD